MIAIRSAIRTHGREGNKCIEIEPLFIIDFLLFFSVDNFPVIGRNVEKIIKEAGWSQLIGGTCRQQDSIPINIDKIEFGWLIGRKIVSFLITNLHDLSSHQRFSLFFFKWKNSFIKYEMSAEWRCFLFFSPRLSEKCRKILSRPLRDYLPSGRTWDFSFLAIIEMGNGHYWCCCFRLISNGSRGGSEGGFWLGVGG